jgi:hypothetical protein
MKKSYMWIIIGICAIVVLGIIVGIFVSKNSTKDEQKVETKLVSTEQNIQNGIELISTSYAEVKASPNCLFEFKTYYKGCKHTTTKRENIPEELVNKTEIEMQDRYKDYKIEEFTANNIVLYQEKEGICDEHYLLKENNGYIAIYKIDNAGKEILKENTQIVTTYLPETDKQNLKNGIKIIGKENLSLTLEDYE